MAPFDSRAYQAIGAGWERELEQRQNKQTRSELNMMFYRNTFYNVRESSPPRR